MQRHLVSLFLALTVAACSAHAGDRPAPAPAATASTPRAQPAGEPNAAAPHPGGGIEHAPRFKNLKVLPADISKDELMGSMRQMSLGLGVRCNYCHVTEPARDFAADTDHKEAARGMMRMTARIQKELFTWPDAPKASCYMCHHGSEHPVTEAPRPEEAPAGPRGPTGAGGPTPPPPPPPPAHP